MRRRNEREPEVGQFGPVYDLGSPALNKFRKVANKAKGVMKLERFYRVQYADAVEAAVLAKQRSFLKSHSESQPRPMCASGTWHSDGEQIAAAIRARHNAALLACPGVERRARTPEQWKKLYAIAMKEKWLATRTPKQLADDRAELARLKAMYEEAA